MMKEIQGDINNLGIDDKLRLQQKAWTDYNKACEAWQQEQAGNHKEAIKKWGEILETTSRHTDNSIFTCQNEEIRLKCQLAQK